MSDRIYPRVSINTEATIRYGERDFTGVLGDLSLSGVYVKMDSRLPKGDLAEVSFFDTVSAGKVTVKANGNVVRNDDSGIAFSLREMDVDSFLNLRLIVARHSATH